jgi:hypothetical protein
MSSPTQISGTPSPSPARIEEPLSPDLVVTPTRARQTTRAQAPFRDVLTGGVELLIRGAEVATSVVAGPVMAAAVREAGFGATSVLASATRPIVPRAQGFQARGTQLQERASVGGTPAIGIGSVAASLTMPSSAQMSDQTDLGAMQSMQRESQLFNLQLLELQEDVQQENRRFTTVSNVLRAKHDTAKAAVSNIRG